MRTTLDTVGAEYHPTTIKLLADITRTPTTRRTKATMKLQNRLTQYSAITLCLIALAGCDQRIVGGGGPSSPSVSAITRDAKAEAFAKSEAAVKEFNEQPRGHVWVEDYVDAEFAKKENENNAAFKANIERNNIQLIQKTYRINKTKASYYQPSPPATTVLVCSTSNTRLIDKNGNDITRDQRNQPVPDKDNDYAAHFSLNSKDEGLTWQITGYSEASVAECSAP